MSPRSTIAAACLAFALVACTGTGEQAPGGQVPQISAAPIPSSPEVASPANETPGSAAAAAERLCEVSQPDVDQAAADVAPEGPTPPVIDRVMRQIEQLRGFDYSEPVAAQPVSQKEIGEDLVAYTAAAYPRGQYARRSRAWEAIGVIPDGTSLRDAFQAYGSTQVIGYYDTITGELKFTGSQSPSPLEQITLAHELTHAIDDQRFGLERLDALNARCRDEDAAAALAVVEGNATFFMLRWARTYLSAEEQVQAGIEAAAQDVSTEGIPEFVLQLQMWSYDQGLRFISSLESRGGLDAVDGAFRTLPTSTEQIIHPERYPNDVPTPVDVPDLSAELGGGWNDLDVMTVGEEWLKIALGLRLDGSEASAAAAGWDGGMYRAWSNGDQVAVVLSTVWDTETDADAFASAMDDWIDRGGGHGLVSEPRGRGVTVLFGSDDGTLQRLRAAVG